MSSMAIAAAQKVAAPSFSPYASTPSLAALSADASVGSHVVAGNSSHRQGQQSPMRTPFRGVLLPPSLTPPPQNATRGMARGAVQLAEPQFKQSEYGQAMAVNTLFQQRLEAERQGFGTDFRPSFGPELGDHGQFLPPSTFADSLAPHADFGRDLRAPAPVYSRYYAPFPGAYRNDAGFRGDAAFRDERLAEDYSRMMSYRREQDFERPSTSFDRTPSSYSHRPFSNFPVEEKPPPDAFASLANRLNNASRNHNWSASLELNHRPFTAADPPPHNPRPHNPRIDTQPFNTAIAGIVESLEKSLLISPPGERSHEWAFSPRGQETPRYRTEEELRSRNGRGFEGFRELDDVLPNGRQVDPTRVMVSGISWQMSAHQIRDELVHRCSKLGKVVDIEVAQYRGNSPSQLDRGRHRGFAFVTMDTPEQASLVMAALHKVDMGGMQVQTKPGVVKDPMFARRNYAKKKAEEVVHKPLGRKHVKVFVGNLWFGTDAERLREAFHEFGLIVDTKVVRDKDSGESRGFGFVTFANESSAIDAISARDGAVLDGRKLVVNVSRSWAGSSGEEESGSDGASSEFSHERH